MNKRINSHKDLEVYQSSISFVAKVYELVKSFPGEEKYGITTQLKRAAVSISLNIAEGAARQSTKEFIRFLYISLGSATEVETLFEIIESVQMSPINEELSNDIIHIKRMLIKLIDSLNKKL